MDSINILKNCYGCGVCSCICPKHIIKLSLTKDGFYQPYIVNEKECIHCGLCLETCSFYMDMPLTNHKTINTYATWSKNEEIRKSCSSGGTGYEIASYLLGLGYHFIGVKYNVTTQRAEHYIASTKDDLKYSQGSKYIQSYSSKAFQEIIKGNKYIITGTPCQIASLKRFIHRKKMDDKVILIDFFCHGIPSYLLWYKYLKEYETSIGPIIDVSWRNKLSGWHDSWCMTLKSSKTTRSNKKSDGDIFYKFFLGNMCFNRACYKDCKFKFLSSAADIRIGDLWGNKYKNDSKGITGVICFTEKGTEVLKRTNIYLKHETLQVILEGQIKNKIIKPYYYSLLLKLLRTNISLSKIYNILKILRIITIIKYKLHIK